MCSGHQKHSSSSTPPAAGGDGFEISAALLLELAASDDLPSFRRAVEDGHPLDAAASWYCRTSASAGRKRMGFEQRTPLMISALYGSTSVMGYVLAACPGEATRRSPSDGVTALHCAAAGGASCSLETAQLLLDASGDLDALDAGGNRAGDLIARRFPSSAAIKSLEILLKASPASPPRAASPGKEEETAAKQSEKKEYPLDLTLPDIKTGIYSTDEFRMYTFKVKPCSRAYSHDWTECPFVHPGENARRRDPRKYSYTCVPCPEFRKGSCRNGDTCEYAHGVFECWLHPAQYRTRLCKDEIACNRRVCFFAHKPEEIRQVNPTAASVAGMVLPSPRSSSPGLSPVDMATALMLMQQQQQQPGSPMSPSASSGLGAAATWLNQSPSSGMMTPPSLQLPASRLKTSLSARDLNFELDLLGLEGYQQKLLDEISKAASPRANWGANSLAAAPRASDYSDLFGTVDPSLLNQFQGLSVNQSSPPRFQTPNGIQKHQSQLLSAYSGSLPSSPTASATSSMGVDHSMAKAIMNSRASAFAKRSQSFCDRGAAAGRQSTLSAMTSAAVSPPVYSNWSSPDGKLDWGLQGEELNKLRKSASFGFRNGQVAVAGLASSGAANSPPPGFNEPDVSWVQSLVKDGPAASTVGRLGTPKKHNMHQVNGGNDFHGSDLFSPWAEHEKIMA